MYALCEQSIRERRGLGEHVPNRCPSQEVSARHWALGLPDHGLEQQLERVLEVDDGGQEVETRSS